jgi:hypothetical protein
MTSTSPFPLDEPSDEVDAEIIDIRPHLRGGVERAHSSTAPPENVQYLVAERPPRPHRLRPNARDTAAKLIEIAADPALDNVERSNAFDAWRDELNELAGRAFAESNAYRELLGLVLAASLKADLCDLSLAQLKVFRDATTRLGAPSVTTIDVERISSDLRRSALPALLPLATDDVGDDVRADLARIISRAERSRG